MKVSFSRTVKEEVVFNDFNECCSKAMLCAIIKINGTLALSNQGLALTIRTENAKIASKIHKMLKETYAPTIEFLVSRKMKLKKNNVYVVKVSKAREILDDLSLMSGFGFQDVPDKKMIRKECCKRAYLAGAFLSSGSVNPPDTSNYHLEISLSQQEHATFIQDLMNRFDLNAKCIQRRNKYIVYLKSSEKIGDFMRAIGASQSVMHFETTRIDRNMSNTVNRWNNCDIANEMKSITTANKHIEDIHVIEMFLGIDMLDDKTKKVAKVRLKYPEVSLKELANYYLEETGETISKSGLHHRLKKIHDEAERLRVMETN
ncbi:DNA-binding protein WhiA [Tannockella kyphosi]|uniref:DNA-binding protein WhiA n=1 Tax=Tannockella kyphosi TaxID=2899121 RepID=UPI002010D7EB|nr:DNA-binding protein WhiA [Tannockella kyphosi]